MSLIAIGLSHKTASIELREQFVSHCGCVEQLGERLKQAKLSKEIALLSTCNRVEIYAVPEPGSSVRDIHQLITRLCGITNTKLKDQVYAYSEKQALTT